MEKRLLCVFSHPDDESYGPAGTIHSVAADPSGKVRVIVASRGEAGSLGISKNYSPYDLGRIREKEMFEAARTLGIEVRFLGYPDRHIGEVPADRAVNDILREIQIFKPHVLLTFHPNGISGHADHKAVSGFVLSAWNRTLEPSPDNGLPWRPSRLFYYGISSTRAKALNPIRKVETIPDEEIDLTLDVSAHVSTKHAACRAHGTQLDFYERLQKADGGIDRFWSRDEHVLGAWWGNPPKRPIRDLFQDVSI